MISFLLGCTTTLGDAAFRGGHSTQAAALYQQGAEQCDGTAALKLGLMIHEGKAPVETFGSETKWFIRACELGNEAGCHNSGNAYEYGQDGLRQDYSKAAHYYRLAAEKGYMQSEYNLGIMYANQYVDDDIEGLKWILLAEKSASSCSTVPLCKWVLEDPPWHHKKLVGRMSAEQIAKANQVALAWQAKP